MYISLYLGRELSLVCTYIRTRRVIFSVIFFSYIFMIDAIRLSLVLFWPVAGPLATPT